MGDGRPSSHGGSEKGIGIGLVVMTFALLRLWFLNLTRAVGMCRKRFLYMYLPAVNF